MVDLNQIDASLPEQEMFYSMNGEYSYFSNKSHTNTNENIMNFSYKNKVAGISIKQAEEKQDHNETFQSFENEIINEKMNESHNYSFKTIEKVINEIDRTKNIPTKNEFLTGQIYEIL